MTASAARDDRCHAGRVRAARAAAAGALGSTGWWGIRHATSPAVRAWRPGAGRRVPAGALRVRVFGSGDPVVLLLHGIVTSGDYFGGAYDVLAERATLVVPDLLGFGASMWTEGPFDGLAHVAALDAALDDLGLGSRPTVVAGHSMGGSLALRWAAANTDSVASVVVFGGPLYRDRAEATHRVRAMGRTEALLARDGPLPRHVCAWMCRHRTAASWLAAAQRPDLPVTVARHGVKHTWATYSGAYDGLIGDRGWQQALARLTGRGTPVALVEGAADPVPVPGRAAELARTTDEVTHLVHPTGDHGLPITHPDWCARAIASRTGA